MKKSKAIKIVIGIVVGAAVVVAVTVLALDRLAASLCANELIETAISPDKQHKAILFERDCGATTDFSSQVSILDSDEDLPNAYGNTFIAEAERNGQRASWVGPWVEIKWRSPNELEVSYDRTAEVYEKYETVESIRVIYVPTSP